MPIILSTIALCISIAGFAFTLFKHTKEARISKFVQHRNAVVLAAEAFKSAVQLREKARSIDNEMADEMFSVIENLTSNMATIADQIKDFDPLLAALEDLHRLETKVHKMFIQVIHFDSMLQDVSGFWGTGAKAPQIEQGGI